MSRLRLRLRATAAAAALLLVGPALLLRVLPRPEAQGLERLLPQVALLQSLPAAPSRPVPQLWRQRLGAPLADRLWRQQRRTWWQGWGRHGEGGAYLVVPLPQGDRPAAQRQAPHSFLLNDLLVVAPDPLARRALQDQLRNVQRPLRGLERRCLLLLQERQAVFWKPAGLGGLSGALAPLLLRYQEGCLALELLNGELAFQGEAAAVAAPSGEPPEATLPLPPPLSPSLLLEVRGPSLAPLLQGFLDRNVVREALASGYGIGPAQLRLLRQLPFRLRLRPLAAGPFRAGLELQFGAGAQSRELARLLSGLRPRLQQQGLDDAPPQWGSGPRRPELPPPSTWRRGDGTVVGGWYWLGSAERPAELVVFLGPLPAAPAPEPLQPSSLQLSMRPAAMAASGLLPIELPAVVQRATQLRLAAAARSGGPLSRLQGRLQLGPLPATH